MSFPSSPYNGQVAKVNNISYQYNSTVNRWQRLLGTVNSASTATYALSFNTSTLVANAVTATNLLLNQWSVTISTATGNLQLTSGTQSISNLGYTGGNISWSTANQTDFQGNIKVGGGTIKSGGGAASIVLNNNGFTAPSIGITQTSGTTSSTTGALTVAGGVGVAGGLFVVGIITASNITAYTSAGSQFIGDFDNVTVNNRTVFVTKSVNSSTGIYAIPNGTSAASSWQAANNSNLTNASKILIATNGSTDVQLVSGVNGTGTYLPLSFYNGGVQQMVLSTTGTLTINTGSLVISSGTIYSLVSPGTTSTVGASQVGYLGMPQNIQSTSYTLIPSDAGKHIYISATGQTVTIPANSSVPFPIGTTIAIIAGPSATTVSIAITSDTMYLGGTGTTGTRTLAAYGMATAVKVAQSTWFINGTGLT